MSRYAKDRRTEPALPKVKRVELEEKHAGRRLLIAAALLALGGLCIAWGVTQCNAVNEGWNIISPDKNVDTDAAAEFTLMYELGAAGTDTVSENKGLTVAYSKALEHACQLFSSLVEYEGVVNLWYLSAHPNEECVVDDELYAALALLEAKGNRDIFLAPIFDVYLGLFSCTDDSQVVYYDARTDAATRAYFDDVLAFVHDPAHIRIELLGGNKVCLRVSADYLAFCAAEGITHLVDLGWMKNAFVVDAVADALVAAGYTHGCLSSFDGFARNLDTRTDVTYALDLYERVGKKARQVATMGYPPATRALVALRTYALGGALDVLRYYETADGTRYFAYLDMADGLCRASVPELVCASATLSCAEIALAVAPVYIADTLDTSALDGLLASGIWHVRIAGGAIICNGGATFTDLADGSRVA